MNTLHYPEEPTSLDASERRAWSTVDTEALTQNARVLQRTFGSEVALLGVVKADGYGHGATVAARAMLAGGARGLAVATVGEGRRLRVAGIAAPVLVLGYTPPTQVAEAQRFNLTLTVSTPETLAAASAHGRAHGCPMRVHVKIDTGMHRLGLLPEETLPFLRAARDVEGVEWHGLYTHFACADEPDRSETAQQIAQFEAIMAQLRAEHWQFAQIHAANSAGALYFPRARYNAVRVGMALYGGAPNPALPLPPGIRSALGFHTRVVRLADLPANSPVSYGGTYRTPSPRRIATLAAGYADGIRRSPAWREVLIREQRAPIVGRVCMDYAMADVTNIANVEVGDVVTLLGTQGRAAISAEEVAEWLDTSAYEVLTCIAPRQPRS